MSKTTPEIICDILKTTLKLSDDVIWIWNQRRAIPEDKKLYCVVGIVDVTPYSNSKVQTVVGEHQYDSITTYVKETVSIDLFSYTTEAIEKYSNYVAALRSTYCVQQQELLGLKIADIPSTISEVSDIEGTALIYRMVITLQILRKYEIIFENDYYNEFTLTETKTD